MIVILKRLRCRDIVWTRRCIELTSMNGMFNIKAWLYLTGGFCLRYPDCFSLFFTRKVGLIEDIVEIRKIYLKFKDDGGSFDLLVEATIKASNDNEELKDDGGSFVMLLKVAERLPTTMKI
ncbi:hypothetical protein ACOSQ2_000116 [Xanthoceras sorbifolium]